MKNMTLTNIARACGGRLICPGEPSAAEAAGVVIDSRKAGKDFLFIATKGERVDGHRFIPEVFAGGALGVVCEQLPEQPAGPCILVEDSFEALKRIGEFYRRQLPVKVVGITGSVGKTSTKEFVASVLSQKYRVHKTLGNYNNEIGVPLTVLSMPEDTEVAVLEMGINHFGEMHNLSRIARPDICIMTNIGQCHLEFLGSREGILKAKSEIFDFMSEDGAVCVNGDDDMLSTIKEVKGKAPVTFGLSQSCRIYADDIAGRGLFGSEAVIHDRDTGMSFDAQIPLPGGHMVYNALAATAAGCLLGLTPEEISKGIAAVESVSGRSHIVQLEDKVVIDDCYNANPVSMEAALDLLLQADGRTVAVLGDMFELGEEEAGLHARVGGYAVEKGADCLICTGKLSRHMYEGALKAAEAGNKPAGGIHYFPDRESLLEGLADLLLPGDTILVKASHGMGFEKVVEQLS
ncbi:UDP-N-acetylmuramoyl-tripeptide--D-alanyl-D-alanine ligase [Eisenbergiella sp.]